MAKNNLKMFVRYSGDGNIVAGSNILAKNKPKIGKWVEINPTPCCTTTTSTTALR